MDERRPAEIERLVEVVASVEPPDEVKARVRAAVRDALPRRRRRKLWLAIVLLPATAVAAVGVHQIAKRDAPTEAIDAAHPRAGVTKERPPVNVVAEPPAPAEPEVAPAIAPEPAVPKRRPRHRPRRRAVRKPAPPRTVPAPPSQLSQQVAAYKEAMRLRNQGQRTAALSYFRKMRQRWSDSPLVHEADLRIIETLLQLGRAEEARAEARRFLARYPRSPKAAHVRRLLAPDGGSR